MTGSAVHDVVVIDARDAGATLRDAGVTDFVIVAAHDVVSWVFDEAAHTWAVRTRGEKTHRGRVVIDGAGVAATDRDGEEAYLGVAVHGLPNYFLATGPNTEAQVRYTAACLTMMARTGSTRIEVRRSTQRLFNDRLNAKQAAGCGISHARLMRAPAPSAFDLSSGVAVEDEVYDGAARLTLADGDCEVKVRLTGHLDPIDGRYHWQGIVSGALPVDTLTGSAAVTLTVGERSAPARITEQTPWGSYGIAGVGAPPFALDDVELTVPHVSPVATAP